MGSALSLRELRGQASVGGSKLGQALSGLRRELRALVSGGDYRERLRGVFGSTLSDSAIERLRKQWERGNVVFPQIEIRNREELGGADGGYSKDTGKIYLAREVLNDGSYGDVQRVLMEEYGHYIDDWYNKVESVGDEGARFAGVPSSINPEGVVVGDGIRLEQAYKAPDDRVMLLQRLRLLGVDDPKTKTMNLKDLWKYVERVAPVMEAKLVEQGLGHLVPKIGYISSPLSFDLGEVFRNSVQRIYEEYKNSGFDRSLLADYVSAGDTPLYVSERASKGMLPTGLGAPPPKSTPLLTPVAYGRVNAATTITPNVEFGSQRIHKIIDNISTVVPPIRGRTGVVRPYTMYGASSPQQFASLLGGNKDYSGVAGVYRPNEHTTYIQNVRETPSGHLRDVPRTALHEAVHGLTVNLDMVTHDPFDQDAKYVWLQEDSSKSPTRVRIGLGESEGLAEYASRLVQMYDRGVFDQRLVDAAAAYALAVESKPERFVRAMSSGTTPQARAFDALLKHTLDRFLAGENYQDFAATLTRPKAKVVSGDAPRVKGASKDGIGRVLSAVGSTGSGGGANDFYQRDISAGSKGGSKKGINFSKFAPLTIQDINYMAEQLGGKFYREIPAVLAPEAYIPYGKPGHIKGQFQKQNRPEIAYRFDDMESAKRFMVAITGADNAVRQSFIDSGILPLLPHNLRAYELVYGGDGTKQPVEVRMSIPGDSPTTSGGRALSSAEVDEYYRKYFDKAFDLEPVDNTQSKVFKSGKGGTGVEFRIAPKRVVDPVTGDVYRPAIIFPQLADKGQDLAAKNNLRYLDEFGIPIGSVWYEPSEGRYFGRSVNFNEAVKNSGLGVVRPRAIANPNALRLDQSVFPPQVLQKLQGLATDSESTLRAMREILTGGAYESFGIPKQKGVSRRLSQATNRALERVIDATSPDLTASQKKKAMEAFSSYDESGKRLTVKTLYDALDALKIPDQGKLMVALDIASGRELLKGDRSTVLAVGQKYILPDGNIAKIADFVAPRYGRPDQRLVVLQDSSGRSIGTVPEIALLGLGQKDADYFSLDVSALGKKGNGDDVQTLASALRLQKRLQSRGLEFPNIAQSYQQGVIVPRPPYEDWERTLLSGEQKLLPASTTAGKYVPSVEVVGDTASVRKPSVEVDPRLLSKTGKPLHGAARDAVVAKLQRFRVNANKERNLASAIVDPLAGTLPELDEALRQQLIEKQFFDNTRGKAPDPIQQWVQEHYRRVVDKVNASIPSTERILPPASTTKVNPSMLEVVGDTKYRYVPPNALQRVGAGLSNMFGNFVQTIMPQNKGLPAVFGKFGNYLEGVNAAATGYRAEQVARFNRLALPESATTGKYVPSVEVVGDTTTVRGSQIKEIDRAVLDNAQRTRIEANRARNLAASIDNPMAGLELYPAGELRQRLIEDAFRKSFAPATTPLQEWARLQAVQQLSPPTRNILPPGTRLSALAVDVARNPYYTVPVKATGSGLTAEEIRLLEAADQTRTRTVLNRAMELGRSPDFNPNAIASRFGTPKITTGSYVASLKDLEDFLTGKTDTIPLPPALTTPQGYEVFGAKKKANPSAQPADLGTNFSVEPVQSASSEASPPVEPVERRRSKSPATQGIDPLVQSVDSGVNPPAQSVKRGRAKSSATQKANSSVQSADLGANPSVEPTNSVSKLPLKSRVVGAGSDDFLGALAGGITPRKPIVRTVDEAIKLASKYPTLPSYEAAVRKGEIDDIPMVRNVVALSQQVNDYARNLPPKYRDLFDRLGLTPSVGRMMQERIASGLYQFPMGTGYAGRMLNAFLASSTDPLNLSSVDLKIGTTPDYKRVYTPDEIKVIAQQGLNASLYQAIAGELNNSTQFARSLNNQLANMDPDDPARELVKRQIKRLEEFGREEFARLFDGLGLRQFLPYGLGTGVTELRINDKGSLVGFKPLPFADLTNIDPSKPKPERLGVRPSKKEVEQLKERFDELVAELVDGDPLRVKAFVDLANRTGLSDLAFSKDDWLVKQFESGNIQFEKTGSNRFRVGDGRYGITARFSPEQLDQLAIALVNEKIKEAAFRPIKRAEVRFDDAWTALMKSGLPDNTSAKKLIRALDEARIDRIPMSMEKVSAMPEFQSLPEAEQNAVKRVVEAQRNLYRVEQDFAGKWEGMIDSQGKFNPYAWRDNSVQTILSLQGGDLRYDPVLNHLIATGSSLPEQPKYESPRMNPNYIPPSSTRPSKRTTATTPKSSVVATTSATVSNNLVASATPVNKVTVPTASTAPVNKVVASVTVSNNPTTSIAPANKVTVPTDSATLVNKVTASATVPNNPVAPANKVAVPTTPVAPVNKVITPTAPIPSVNLADKVIVPTAPVASVDKVTAPATVVNRTVASSATVANNSIFGDETAPSKVSFISPENQRIRSTPAVEVFNSPKPKGINWERWERAFTANVFENPRVFGHTLSQRVLPPTNLSVFDVTDLVLDTGRVLTSQANTSNSVDALTSAGLQTGANLTALTVGANLIDRIPAPGVWGQVAKVGAKIALPMLVNMAGDALRKPTERAMRYNQRVDRLLHDPQEQKIEVKPFGDGNRPNTMKVFGEDTNPVELANATVNALGQVTIGGAYDLASMTGKAIANMVYRDTIKDAVNRQRQAEFFDAGQTLLQMGKSGTGKVVVGDDGQLKTAPLNFEDYRKLSLRMLLDKRNYNVPLTPMRSGIGYHWTEAPQVGLSVEDLDNLRKEGYSRQQIDDYVKGKTKVLGEPELKLLEKATIGRGGASRFGLNANQDDPEVQRRLQEIRQKYNADNYVSGYNANDRTVGSSFGSELSAALSQARKNQGLKGGQMLSQQEVENIAQDVSNRMGFSFRDWINSRSGASLSFVGANVKPSSPSNKPTAPATQTKPTAPVATPRFGGWW